MSDTGRRAPSRVIGRYALYGEIASGGMATVHLGRLCGPAGFSPLVAIKALHPHLAKDQEFVAMFLDEARLAARVRHPNVVPVLDVHAVAGELFLVLEYVHGESLARLIQPAKESAERLPPQLASAIVCDVLHGLHAAHEATNERGEDLEIVHRDVSPQNILVGVDGIARVLDFGVAKATGRLQSTRDGQVKGKVAYMAPEQLRGGVVSCQVDVYATAVVLWEALTGERLFRSEDEGSTLEKVLFAPVDPPSKRVPSLPPALDAVVLRGLARERAQRFGSAKEMALALQAAVAPASPPEVGEWVEARAVDILSERSTTLASVEGIEAAAAHGATSAAANKTSGGPTAGAPFDGPVSQLSSISVSKTTVVRGAPRRILGGWVTAALVLTGLLTWAAWRPTRPLVRDRSSSHPDTEASAVTTLAATPPAVPLPQPSTTTENATMDNVARDTNVVQPRAPTRRSAAHSVQAVTAASSTPALNAPPPTPATVSPPSRCGHPGPDGVIEFDTACLREAQPRP